MSNLEHWRAVRSFAILACNKLTTFPRSIFSILERHFESKVVLIGSGFKGSASSRREAMRVLPMRAVQGENRTRRSKILNIKSQIKIIAITKDSNGRTSKARILSRAKKHMSDTRVTHPKPTCYQRTTSWYMGLCQRHCLSLAYS